MFLDQTQRGTAIAIWTSCFMSGIALGPVIGGLLLESFWWGSAFLIGVPVMVLLLILGPRVLPEYRDPNAGRLDLLSVALYLLAVLPAMYGLKEIARNGPGGVSIAAFVAGLAFGALCIRRQWRLEYPLFDLKLFRDLTFRSIVTIFLPVGVMQAGAFLMINLYLQLVAGLSTLEAGLRLLPSALAMVGATLAAPRIASRIPQVSVIAAALVIAATGYVVISQVGPTGGVPTLTVGLVNRNEVRGARPPFALQRGICAARADWPSTRLSRLSGESVRGFRPRARFRVEPRGSSVMRLRPWLRRSRDGRPARRHRS